MTMRRADLFRPEAIESYRTGLPETGAPLRISSRWIMWSYWLVLAAVAAGVSLALLGTVHEYATGPAVIRAEGRTTVTARLAGTVASIEVRPGQRVSTGDVLVRFDVDQESASLDRLSREMELQTVEVLRNPSDQAARQALITLRADRTLANARVEERIVRAPQAGVVRDVRIRPGQQLNAGQSILSLIDDNSRFVMIALLPGHYRPLLKRGIPVRLELSGYRYTYQNVVLEAIGDEVVGPAEIQRYLGDEIGDAIPISGPAVIVRTVLPSRTFTAEGRTLQYFDGMQGTAEASVREESILFTLVPGLRALVGDGGA